VYRADKSEAETQPTPITFKMHRGDPPFDIQLRAEGYVSQTRTITSDESVKLLVSLAKLPTVLATPTPVPDKAPTPTAPPKVAAPKVSNATKVKKIKPPPKATEPDRDGIMKPSFGD